MAMTKRDFISRLAIGAAAFTILPGAGRVWRDSRRFVVTSTVCHELLFKEPGYILVPTGRRTYATRIGTEIEMASSDYEVQGRRIAFGPVNVGGIEITAPADLRISEINATQFRRIFGVNP